MHILIKIFKNEALITIGMFRYWVMVLFSYLMAITLFVLNSALHANYSAYSSSFSPIAPRDGIVVFHEICLTIFIILMVVLCVDIRARDTRNQMTEVLDSRPYSNASLVFGRFFGVFTVVWVSSLLMLLVVDIIGGVLPLAGYVFGGTLDPRSIFAFVVYMAFPALIFSGGFSVLTVLLLRNRFLALAASIGMVFGAFLIVEDQSYTAALASDITGRLQLSLSSDWGASFTSEHWWIQRLGMLVMGVGFLLFATFMHPRLDSGAKLKLAVSSVVSLSAGVVLIFSAYHLQNQKFQQLERWRQVYTSHNAQPIDLDSFDVSVEVKTGKSIQIDLNMVIKNIGELPIDKVLFTLNPGFELVAINGGDGQSLPFTHDKGLLEVTFPEGMVPAVNQEVTVVYNGAPDTSFGYLDGKICLCDRNIKNGLTELRNLGREVGIFNDDYLALMHGLHWLPELKPADEGQVTNNKRDFFELNLAIELPDGWTAVGPDKPDVSANNVFAFKPSTKVSEVTLIAAPFIHYSTVVKDVTFSIFLHADRTRLVNALTPAKEEIKTWLESRLALAADSALHYPFRTFSLVEVPNSLRIYGGGWQDESVLAPPSMGLVRENNLPSARFDVVDENVFSDLLTWRPEYSDGAESIRRKLFNYLSNDFSGSNIFTSFSRSMFNHQVYVYGKDEDSDVLSFALNELATMVVSGSRSYFTVEGSLAMGEALDQVQQAKVLPEKSVAENVVHYFTRRHAVWEAVESHSLNSVADENPAVANDALVLRGGQLAQLIYDTLGVQATGRFLTQLLSSSVNNSVSFARVESIAKGQSQQLSEIFDAWFNAKAETENKVALAGIKVDDVAVYELNEPVNGRPAYQYKLLLSNTEPVDGYLRVAWFTDNEKGRNYSDPLRLPAHSSAEYGVVLSTPPAEVYIDPYLSLNRFEFKVKKAQISALPTNDTAAFTGFKLVDGKSDESSTRLVIDDLGAGFEVVQPKGFSLGPFNPAPAYLSQPLDNGIPPAKGLSRYWSRREVGSAWGNYRHTVVYIQRGDGNAEVRFKTELPSSGRWKLQINIPALEDTPIAQLGSWSLRIEGIQGTENLQFNAANAGEGWNDVAEYNMDSGKVDVVLTDQTTGVAVIADAVSWLPLDQ